jgi:hypothetical protein
MSYMRGSAKVSADLCSRWTFLTHQIYSRCRCRTRREGCRSHARPRRREKAPGQDRPQYTALDDDLVCHAVHRQDDAREFVNSGYQDGHTLDDHGV